jgi:Rieske Fe-S protein
VHRVAEGDAVPERQRLLAGAALREQRVRVTRDRLTRRMFMKGVGAGLVVIKLPSLTACGSAGPVVSDRGADPVDLAGRDLRGGAADLIGTCPASFTVNAGAAAAIAEGRARFDGDGKLFVCRDEKGLYAVSAICTHQGCVVAFSSSARRFTCGCHGSQFTFDGKVAAGPANRALPHFAMCVDGQGNARVDPDDVVSSTTRTG